MESSACASCSRQPSLPWKRERWPTAQRAATKPSGTSDRPRQREAERRRVHALDEQRDRRDAGRGREQRVLEGAEPEHAHARLTVGDPGLPECVQVDGEAAACDERAEAGRDGGDRRSRRDPRPALDARHLAVAEDVADVGDRLRRERHGEPFRANVVQPLGDLAEARRRGDDAQRRERDGRRPDHEQTRVGGRALQVRPGCPPAEAQPPSRLPARGWRTAARMVR